MTFKERVAIRTNTNANIQVAATGLAAAGAAAMTYSSVQGLLASDILVNTMIYGAATAGSAVALVLLLLVFGYLVADLMSKAEGKTTPSVETTTEVA